MQVGYKPAYAQEQSAARRWSGSRLERDPVLRGIVLVGLAAAGHPRRRRGGLRQQISAVMISYESIYRFIYAQMARTHDGAWRSDLPKAKFKRRRRGRKGGSPARFIQDRVSISQRPKAVESAAAPGGHWEADLMLFATYGQAILVAHGRKSRIMLLAKQPGKA